jgi:hypothetical protein
MADQIPAMKSNNPLSQYFRQPKIYIRLPSEGRFYPPNTLDRSENGSYAVYAMTARDELMFKTPDALLSGQSTVEVIKSCVPAILDPWKMPTIDLDAVLIAIRVATYGDKMEVTANCPTCDTENSFDVNLSNWLETISNFHYESAINCDPLIIHIRPYTYDEMTKTNIKALEQQRLINIVNDEKLSDEEKLKKFGESFVKLTELTVDIVAGCISKIETPEGETSNSQHIKDFVNNAPKELFDHISNHITNLKDRIELKPLDVQCSQCKFEFAMPITMDQSNFFAVRS